MATTKVASAKKTTAPKAAAVKKPAAVKATPVKKAAVAKEPAAEKKSAAKKSTVTKAVTKTTTKTAKPAKISNEERYRMVEVAAYFMAERNNFKGSPVEYWSAAEAQISALLAK